MEEIGVEAVVKGLTTFLGSMQKMDSSIAKTAGNASLLGKAFSFVGDIVSGLTSGVLRILEYTLGSLLASAIRAVVSQIKELITATIDAGSEFQTLELRLRNLNLNAAMQSTDDYTTAMSMATEATRQQLEWIQKLAIQTPYDTQEIANVFTLARSYGFAADESQTLTESISNFAAGMGLGNQEIERIIVNFGQMVQQGKASGREMTDLARGSFVPVNDILAIMQKETGLTGAAFDDFRNSGEGVQSFINAFTQLVEQRFSGSAQTMARTFQGATDNIKDFVKSVFGLNVVKPVLDTLGGAIADFLGAFTEEQRGPIGGFDAGAVTTRWEQVVAAAKRIGASISDIVSGITGLLPSAGGVADAIVKGMEGLASWIEGHEDAIIGFFEDVRDVIMDDVVPFIRDELVPNFKKISDWVSENQDLILQFFTTLGEIVGEVFSNLTGGVEGPSTEGVLGGIQEFMQFVVDNKDAIADWATIIIQVIVVFSILASVVSFFVGLAASMLGIIITIAGVFAVLLNPAVQVVIGLIGGALVGALTTVVPIIILIIAVIAQLAIIIGVTIVAFKAWSVIIPTVVAIVKMGFINLKRIVEETLKEVITKIKNADWLGAGKAIIDGIIKGVNQIKDTLNDAIVGAVTAAYNAALAAIGARSPSRLFMNIGDYAMQGMALGIEQAAAGAVQAMQNAMAQVAMPAMAMASSAGSSTITNNNTRQANLTINSSARTEPIVQDFNMLVALSGG